MSLCTWHWTCWASSRCAPWGWMFLICLVLLLLLLQGLLWTRWSLCSFCREGYKQSIGKDVIWGEGFDWWLRGAECNRAGSTHWLGVQVHEQVCKSGWPQMCWHKRWLSGSKACRDSWCPWCGYWPWFIVHTNDVDYGDCTEIHLGLQSLCEIYAFFVRGFINGKFTAPPTCEWHGPENLQVKEYFDLQEQKKEMVLLNYSLLEVDFRNGFAFLFFNR